VTTSGQGTGLDFHGNDTGAGGSWYGATEMVPHRQAGSILMVEDLGVVRGCKARASSAVGRVPR
jgi:hypothetical protein